MTAPESSCGIDISSKKEGVGGACVSAKVLAKQLGPKSKWGGGRDSLSAVYTKS